MILWKRAALLAYGHIQMTISRHYAETGLVCLEIPAFDYGAARMVRS